MSGKVARVHQNRSNRAKAQELADRKVVYKGVLDNPFRIQWPSVAMNVQNTLLARVIALLDGVAQYQSNSQEKRRKRKATMKLSRTRKRIKLSHALPPDASTLGEGEAVQLGGGDDQESEVVPVTESPAILQHLIIGINEVTKDLEALARAFRQSVSAGSSTKAETSGVTEKPHGRLLLVCKDDVDPPILIDHLPNLVAACNSARHRSSSSDITWMVPLSKGTESTLADGLGLRRASAMIIKSTAPGFTELYSLLESVPIMSAAWLHPPSVREPPTRELIPTHIKQLRTTAPKDMKAVKEKRSRERAAAKERRKAKSRAAGTIPKRLVISAS